MPSPDYSAHYPVQTGSKSYGVFPEQCARDLQVWPCEVEQARDYGAQLQRRITRALAELESQLGNPHPEWAHLLVQILRGEDG